MKAIPLIVGAGPVGLGAALFLRRAGISTRIIDAAKKPSVYSKALAVNPRTLEILEPSGITQKMLALGLRIHGARFWKDDKVVGELGFEKLEHKYPFMLALSQATTERLLTEALETAGGKVEREIELVDCSNTAEGVEAHLKHSSDDRSETTQCPWLFAADGAHSAVRRSLQINFNGGGFANPWHLCDLPLKTSLEMDFAHAFFYDTGFLFLIRVIDHASSHSMIPAMWRAISNRQELLEKIPMAEICGEPVWKSDFHISHQINEHLQVGNVYFAGDAAHLHSPMGARGMNLGLEDAWVFSELARLGHANRYESLRKPVDQQVVHQVERFSRIVRGESAIARQFRDVAIHSLIKFHPALRRILPVFAGLDHSLEFPPRASSQPLSVNPEGDYAFERRKGTHAHSP